MKKIAVIGAGAAGLACLRALTRQDMFEVIAYEQSDRVGGTWVYNDKYKPTSIYDGLRTNIPKETMAFPGFAHSDKPDISYVGHADILKYLNDFASHYKLRRYIQFRTTVISVTPVHDIDICNGEKWNITVLSNGMETTSTFDAVLVCNGHFTHPKIPEIPGMEYFDGKILHSHFYRKPDSFTGQKMLILGAGPSGIDIALETANVAKKIYLSHNKGKLICSLPSNVEEVVGMESLTAKKAILRDGTEVDVDTVMFATGYKYHFPFLTDECQPLINNERVVTAYRSIVEVNHPSLFYIGLNKGITSFPQFHYQGEYVSALLRGVATLPSRESMEESIENEYKEKVIVKGLAERFFHCCTEDQWNYNATLAAESNVKPLDSFYEPLFNHATNMRHAQPATFRNLSYRIEASDTFITI